MHLQADAVTEAVAEAIAEARLLDDRAGDAVDGLALGAGHDGLQRQRVARARTTSYASGSSAGSGPVTNVRVQSEQ